LRLHLSACPPFSLWAVVESHGWVYLPPFAADAQTRTLTRVERLENGRVIELFISEAGDGVTVTAREPLNGPEREEVSRKVWWMLGLGEDLRPFYELARGEPALAHVEAQALGRLLRCPTFFEDLVKTILTTNTTWAGTVRMVSALTSRLGDPLPTDPSRNAFPTAAQIARAGEDALQAMGLGYRTSALAALARQVADGALDLESMKDNNRSSADIYHRLRQIKGVGEYAAAMALMLLGCYDYLPVDAWARKLVARQWHGDQPVGPRQVEAAFARWGRWKALAYWFWEWEEETSAV